MVRLSECPVCTSKLTSFKGVYHHGELPVDLFYCLDCESFSSPHSTPLTRGTSLNWHLSVADRNRDYACKLFDALSPDPPQILDIGCGTGTLVEVAGERGGGGVGFDLDEGAVSWGRAQGLQLHSELWTVDTPVPKPNIITCIMVLEHIHWPRPLLISLLEAARRYDALLFISVPWFGRDWWKYLDAPIRKDEFHPLRFPADHVTHFSPTGFKDIVHAMGAKKVDYINAGWPGFVIGL